MAKKTIYTLAASHLDTSWEWTFETSVEKYIPATLYDNFRLFDKYPDYKFGWEGAYRYELMEEYYPEAFEKLKDYVADGRWTPTGSSYENGDVNKPSPEALFRNILYGNGYFMKKFGKRSNDIFLPDCFGFGWALPSIARHAHLCGFTTGKLEWGSAYGIPFDLGKWYGVDGSFVYANLKPSAYSRHLSPATGVRRDPAVKDKLPENEKYGLDMTATFYGTGDRGGSPDEGSVKIVSDEINKNNVEETQVVSSTSVELFDTMASLDSSVQDKLPTWNNELLLTNHGTGSYTSRAVGNRWNKNCERLADMAERTAVAAAAVGAQKYPQPVFDAAWKRAIAHQFHDDITGTSLMECYKRNWNDYILSQNQFAEEYRAGISAFSIALDTSFVKGIPVVVNNPVQCDGLRTSAVYARTPLPAGTKYVSVFDSEGKEVPSQIVSQGDEDMVITFTASVPSLGYAVYDVRPATKAYAGDTSVRVTQNTMENAFIRVTFNASGDICELYDKRLGKNVLSSPIRFALFDYQGAKEYPAWELDYPELCKEPREYARDAKIKIVGFGPVLGILHIERKSGRSIFRETVSLDASSDYVRVRSEVDWRDERSLLKLVVPTAASNLMASYDLGLGVIERQTDSKDLYEVPAQVWADITDSSKKFGVSVFSDSRSGWDKPNDTTLRLTIVHTPAHARSAAQAQNLMDLGLNRFGYAVYPHAGSWEDGGVQQKAAEYNEPMQTFTATVHKGGIKSGYSFAGVSDQDVLIRALKKAQDSDEVVVRFNEAAGRELRNVHFRIGFGIDSAREIYATEEDKSDAKVDKGELVFDIGRFEPKSFILKLSKCPSPVKPLKMEQIDLPYNVRAMTTNDTKSTLHHTYDMSIPMELVPDTLVSGGIEFKMGKSHDNAVACLGQTIPLNGKFNRLYVVAASRTFDKNFNLKFDTGVVTLQVSSWSEPLGSWDMIGLGEIGEIKKDVLAWNTTHAHSRTGDIIGKQLYLFRYSIDIPEGAKSVRLPNDNEILVFAVTATNGKSRVVCGSELYDDLDKRPFDYSITLENYLRLRPNTFVPALQRTKAADGTVYVDASKLTD